MKKTLLILLTLIIGINLNTQAHDFSAVYNGKTIYYNITSSTSPRKVSVTYRGADYDSYSGEYSGIVSIPDSVLYNGNYYKVTLIGGDAFGACYGLTSITIPNSITSIEGSAFGDCSGLTSINIPNSVTSIGGFAFAGCSGLTSIIIPNSVTSIGGWAFYGCSGLTSITIPNSVTSISDRVFMLCSGLTSITIPNSVTSIGSDAFSNCSGLTSITIPNSVTSIGDYAFYGCSGLTSINVDLNNIRYSSINGVLFDKVADTLIISPQGKSGSYLIPNSVTSIGPDAFFHCSELTSIIIPNSVTSIGDRAFYNCSGLTSITIPNSVTSISGDAFSYCSVLTSISIGNSVTSIGFYAFSGCTQLASIICNAVNPPINYINTFANVNRSIPLYVPCTSIPSYQSASNWSQFTNYIGLRTAQYITDTICANQTYTNYGANINTAGNYTLVNGCDSIILTLRVSPTFLTNYSAEICKGEIYNNYGFNLTANTSGLYTQNLQTIKGCDSIINLNLIVNPIYNDTIHAEICNGETYNQFGFNENATGFYTQNLQTIKGCDSIVNLNLIVNPTYLTNHFDTICKGQVYNNYGFNLTANTSGLYTQNLQTINSCDSIINLNLVVNPIYNDTIHAEICNGETYNQFGFNENATGFYTQNLQTTKGCDSIVNLNLIVNPTYLTNHFDTICKGQVYNNYGFNFTANTSGLYTQNLQTIKGCDSIINLNLIVNPIYNDTIHAEICNGETYNQFGFNENTTDFYTQNLQTIKGCDSIVNLNLIVNPTYLTNHFDTICKGQVYNNYGFNFTANTTGLYTQNLQTIKGCDSIINLNLIVNPIYNDTITAEICNGETYNQFGFNENATGFYTQNLQTIKGCDSIVNLNLIVNPTYLTNYFDTICKGQVYNNYGFNFTANITGLYIQNLQTIKGCDSIVNLSLIVNPSYNDTIVTEICQGGTYNQYGFNENTTGFYTQNLQTIKGCDSLVNLSLIVNPTYLTNHFDTICKGQVYNNYGFNFTANTSGLYTQNLQTIKGCDSIINLNLVVNPIYNNTITAEICNGETYNQFGFNENATGFYTQNLQTINGCDSIVNLSLTVTSPPNIELYMVTVDINNHNEVIWNKNEMVNHYNIYREGNVMGQFDLIATVPYDSAGMFVDTNSNSMVKSYMYKISTTDTCMNESELSSFHKTMYLTISQGMGWNLNWTPYEGTSYTTYNIYRGINTLDSLKYLTTISASNTSYTDINVPSGYVYYQVEILKDTTTSNKAGEINSIRSNYATNNTNSINEVSSNNISAKLYPNPTSNKATLKIEGLSNDAAVIISDLLGRVIKKYKFNSEKVILEIDVSEFVKGVYSVSVKNNNINVSKKLIVQ